MVERLIMIILIDSSKKQVKYTDRLTGNIIMNINIYFKD